jgi:hypothetical protein
LIADRSGSAPFASCPRQSSPVLASPRQSSTALPRKGTQTSDGRRIPAAAANQNKVRPPGIYSVQLLGIVTLR